MRDFGRNSGGGNRGGRRFDSRGGGNRPMHRATCSQCGKDCEVPFRPTGDKPVYCSSCFGERGGNENRRSYDRNDRPPQRTGPDYARQLDDLSMKLDTIIDLLQHKKKAVKKKPVPSKKRTKLS